MRHVIFFWIGLILSVVLSVLGTATPFHLVIGEFAVLIGIAALFLAVLCSGLFIRSRKFRANAGSEREGAGGMARPLALRMFLFGISPLIAGMVLIVIFR
jgi:hypothetical protein